MSMLALLFDQYADLRPEDPCYLEIEDGGDGAYYCMRCLKANDDTGTEVASTTDAFIASSAGSYSTTCSPMPEQITSLSTSRPSSSGEASH